jgi:hypothetical protein
VFNKTFKILAKSKHDSLLILTPHVMEYLINLNNKYDGKIELSFINHKMYILIMDQNLFSKADSIYYLEEDEIVEFALELDNIKELISFLKNISFVRE